MAAHLARARPAGPPARGGRGRARQAPVAREAARPPDCRRRRSLPCRAASIRVDAAARLTFPVVVKPTVLSGSRGVIRADDALSFVDGVRSRAAAARVAATCASCAIRRPTSFRSRSYIRAPSTRSRAARARRAADARDLRQARSARRPVLRGNDLRHAVARPTRRSSGRSKTAVAARGAGARPASWSDSRRVPRQRQRRLRARSRGAADRRACARSRCASERGGRAIGLEELLLRHALGEPPADWTRERAALGGDDDSDSAQRRLSPRRRRRRGAPRCRASRRSRSRRSRISSCCRCRKARATWGSSSRGRRQPAAAERAVREAHARLRFTIDPLTGSRPIPKSAQRLIYFACCGT